MKSKISRDFHAQNRKEALFSVYCFYLSCLFLVNALMIWYLIILWTPALGYYQAQERQYNLVWCFACIIFAECISRTLEVLTLHIWIPRSIQTSVIAAVDAVAQEVYNFLKDGPRNEDDEIDFGDSPPTFDSSRYLSVANLVSRRLPELMEREVVSAFTPRIPSHYRLRIGTGAIICHYIYLLPVVIQDLLLNLIYTLAIHLVLLSQVFANMNPNAALPVIPLLMVLVLIIIAIIFTTTTEFFTGRRLNEGTLLEEYGRSDSEVRAATETTTNSPEESSKLRPEWGMIGSGNGALTSMKSFFGPLNARKVAVTNDDAKVYPDPVFSSSNSIIDNDNRLPGIGYNQHDEADGFSNLREIEVDSTYNNFDNTNFSNTNTTNSLDPPNQNQNQNQKKEGQDDFLKNPFDGTVTLARRKKKQKSSSNSDQCILQ